MTLQPDEPSLQEVLGEDVTEEERRRLEWAGIHNASQLRELQRENGEHVLEQLVQIPALRLRAALQRASQPGIRNIVPDEPLPGRGPARLRVRGFNLAPGEPLQAHIGGEPVEIAEASDHELVLVPQPHQLHGELTLSAPSGGAVAFAFDATHGASWDEAAGDGGPPSGTG